VLFVKSRDQESISSSKSPRRNKHQLEALFRLQDLSLVQLLWLLLQRGRPLLLHQHRLLSALGALDLPRSRLHQQLQQVPLSLEAFSFQQHQVSTRLRLQELLLL
jgi:hypothetical protein